MLRLTTLMTGLAGAPYYSTQYFDGSTSGEAGAAEDALHNFWGSLVGFIASGLTMQILPEADVVDPATGLVTDTFPIVSTPIVSTGNAPLPKATQGLLRLRTGTFIAGRRIQGRIFIPAMANDSQLGGIPSTAFLAALNGAGATLLTDAAPAGGLVVYSRKNLERGEVTSTSAWTQFAVLRSRRD
jgi:hypothetical protein